MRASNLPVPPLTLKWMVETYTLDCITDAFQIPNEFETATFTFPIQFTCLRSVEKGFDPSFTIFICRVSQRD